MDSPWSTCSLKPRKICLAVCEICHLVSICFLSKFTAMSENSKLLPSAKGPGPLVKFPSQHGLNLHFPPRSWELLMARGSVNCCSIPHRNVACCREGILYITALHVGRHHFKRNWWSDFQPCVIFMTRTKRVKRGMLCFPCWSSPCFALPSHVVFSVFWY